MHRPSPLFSAGPSSRGAQVLEPARLATFLSDAYWASEQCGWVGGLLLIQLAENGAPVENSTELDHACRLIARSARQVDAVGMVDGDTIAVVFKTLERRGDARVMLDRVDALIRASAFEWTLSVGMSVFPLCGPTPNDAWRAARIDLEGARNHDQWEHVIPSETLRAQSVASSYLR